MANSITLNAEYLFEFLSKQQWIDKAQGWFASQGGGEKTVCIDANGNCLNVGLDFAAADNCQTFPVKVYRLVRTSEAYKFRNGVFIIS